MRFILSVSEAGRGAEGLWEDVLQGDVDVGGAVWILTD